MVEIRQATIAEAGIIQQLAEDVWWPTYSSILSPEQMRYMLDNMYDLETIKNQMKTSSQTYLLLLEDNVPRGFASYGPRDGAPDTLKLHKLYCQVQTKGKGFGKMLLQEVEKAVIKAGKHILELNVNRNNLALGFYLKSGFFIAYEEDIDIGSGYWMNDYVMRKIR